MADDTKNEKAAPDRAPDQAPDRFTVEDMIAQSSARFDQPSYVMAGALHDYRNVTITEAEAKKRLESFLTREVT